MDNTLSLDYQQTDFGREFAEEVERLDGRIDDETEARSDADDNLQGQIDTIKASSDVVDIVGTYAELEQYDTTKLNDNDIVKVLEDETHDGGITYYRWSTSTEEFSFVGSLSAYYSKGETDTLLSGKQDKLIAGSNIQIASDGKTISATDTTYSAFTGATASTDGVQGLVPGPLAGDEAKVLKGDGTWGEAAANTIFYRNASETGSTRHIYKNADMTGTVSMQDILDANEKGQVILRLSTASHPEDFSDAYLQNAYVGTNDYQMLFLDEKAYSSFDTTNAADTVFYYSRRELQDKLTAGANIQINGTTISATDTTYSAMTGATSQDAGTSGLVPAPAAGDDMKYLSGDGTWKTINASSVTVFYYNYDSPAGALYSDSAMTTAVKGEDVEAAFNQGKVIVCYKSRSDANRYVEVVNLGYFRWVPNYLWVGMAMESGVYFTNRFYYSDKTTTTCSRETTTFQEPLIAGSNISIIDGPNGPTISATDTTYSAFTGATSSVAGSAGLVPAPTTSDPDKFLKGDGTWGTISQYTPTVFYIDRSLPRYGNTPYVDDVHVYKDSALTETASLQELYDAIDAGGATLVYLSSGLALTYNFLYAFHSLHNGNPDSGGDYMYFAGDDGTVLHTNDQSGQSTNNPAILYVEVDGLYSVDVMRGATSGHAGYRGLVPTPASADRDKFLKGDGTWATVSTGPTVVQATGQSTTDVMSQKAVTDIVGDIETILQTLNSGNGAQ